VFLLALKLIWDGARAIFWGL
jgi:hypothetical protein